MCCNIGTKSIVFHIILNENNVTFVCKYNRIDFIFTHNVCIV